MKNLLMVILLTLFTLSLAACGSGGSSGDSITQTDGSTTDTTTNTGGGTTTGTGSLGDLVDIGDLLGAAGDAWYDTETIDINLSGQIIGSSMDKAIFWDPATPDSMTRISGVTGSFDDFFNLQENPSENTFETIEVLKITDSGLVIGNVYTKNGASESRGFVWDASTHAFINLIPPSYLDTNEKRIFPSYSNAVDISANGEVLLTADYKDGTWAYFWDGTYDTIDDLETAAGDPVPAFQVPHLVKATSIIGADSSEAVALNDHRQMVVNSGGTATFTDLNNGGYASLNSLSGAATTAIDINNNGHVIGNSGSEGFFWRGGVMYPISNPSGAAVEVVDINDNDIVLGNSDGEAFIWKLNPNTLEGVFTFIGDLGGGSSTGVEINNLDEVVGYSTTGNTYVEGNISAAVVHGFLWRNNVMYDLGAHSPPDYSYPFYPDFYFSQARAINEAGDVTGISYSINAHDRGFTLTPTFP